MEIPTPKYKIGDTVFAFNKSGLAPFKITRIRIDIYDSNAHVGYYANTYDLYAEDELIPTYIKAKKRLEENKNQLVLMLT